MKVLVLGAGGMAGHVIALHLQERGHGVLGLARRPLPFCEDVVADVRNVEVIKSILSKGLFDYVINCVGVLNKAVDENPYDGIWLNTCLPHFLVQFTKEMPSRVIHLSTDCVFSGYENGGYKETSFRSADTLYGRSKALGEFYDDKNLTIRTSIVGPDCNVDGVGLFNWFMRQSDSVKGYTDVIWSGVTSIILAEAVCSAMAQGLTGVLHLVNGKTISKFDLLGLFNDLRKHSIDIQPDDAVKENKSLINTRTDFDFSVPAYHEMVQDMGGWIKRHKDLYTQYECWYG